MDYVSHRLLRRVRNGFGTAFLAVALVACAPPPAAEFAMPPATVGVVSVQPRDLPLVLEYAAQLRIDPNARFAVTQSDRDKAQITKAIDLFATVNVMGSCVTPDDLGG